MAYGITIQLNDKFDFNIDSLSKSITLVSELDNLSQSMSLLLNINEGEIKFAPDYGIQITKIMGRAIPMHYIEYIISKSLLKDPRVASITSIVATKSGGIVSIDVEAKSNKNAIVDLRGIIIW